MCHFKLGKPVHHQNLLWWLLTLSISHKPPVPHVMSWLLKWKASPARCQSAEMVGKIVPGVCWGVASPENLQLIQSKLWVLCQEPAFPVCGT